MHTVSSASLTFIACVSAVECTATVLIPISWQARLILSAISPRLAISTFSNIPGNPRSCYRRLLDQQQGGAVFDRPAILRENPPDPSGARRGAPARGARAGRGGERRGGGRGGGPAPRPPARLRRGPSRARASSARGGASRAGAWRCGPRRQAPPRAPRLT